MAHARDLGMKRALGPRSCLLARLAAILFVMLWTRSCQVDLRIEITSKITDLIPDFSTDLISQIPYFASQKMRMLKVILQDLGSLGGGAGCYAESLGDEGV